MPLLGEFAALTTAFLWSFTSLFFTSASRRIGAYWVNKLRIPFAVVFLGTTLLISTGTLFPDVISSRSAFFLIASGVIGLSIGDFFLFSAFVMLGTRLTMLVFSVSPIITALISWIFLGETIGIWGLTGIGLTLTGVAWVSLERRVEVGAATKDDARKKGLGLLMALGGASGQAIGLVLAKAGMSEGVTPLPATFIRMLSAAIAVWLFGLLRRDSRELATVIKNRRAILLALGGSVCGPFLGVWMSLVSIKHTETGIAAAIMATVPVLVIPLVILVYKEKVSARAFIGAVVTVGGIFLLFLK
jgi:drug/metabolite transporter (DMT)-like permease